MSLLIRQMFFDDQEVLPPSTSQRKVIFSSLQGCTLCCGIFGRREITVFCGVQRDPSEAWSLVRFHVPRWNSISKTFCKYSLDWDAIFFLDLLKCKKAKTEMVATMIKGEKMYLSNRRKSTEGSILKAFKLQRRSWLGFRKKRRWIFYF